MIPAAHGWMITTVFRYVDPADLDAPDVLDPQEDLAVDHHRIIGWQAGDDDAPLPVYSDSESWGRPAIYNWHASSDAGWMVWHTDDHDSDAADRRIRAAQVAEWKWHISKRRPS